MLGLMRDPKVPIDLRIEMAAAAAPFVHIRPKRPSHRRFDPTEPRTFSETSFRRMEGKLITTPLGTESGAALTPVDFLLGVMADPGAKTRQRIKAARVAASYLHEHAHPDDLPVVIKDPYGFECDPAVARAIRDDWWEEYRAYQEKIAQDQARGIALDFKPTPKGLVLRARIAGRVKTLGIPAGYGGGDCLTDRNRLHSLFCKRISPPPYNVLTEEEDAEEAHLMARVEVFEASPEGRTLSRIRDLRMRSFSAKGLTAAEQNELDEWRSRHPARPPDPSDPMYKSIMAWRKGRTDN
jgi:hypothetical protein